MFCFLISRYDATPSLRAFSLEPHPPTSHPFTLEICVNSLIVPPAPQIPSVAFLCIVMALDVLLFTVERFQQTKHRKISVCFFLLNACSLQCSPSVRVLLLLEKVGGGAVVMYNRRTEVSLQVDGISSVRSSSSPLSALKVLPKSARNGADFFFLLFQQHTTTQVKGTCHAMQKISVKVPLSSLLAAPG